MKIEIKNRFNGSIILCGEYESIKDCLEKNKGADLSMANLYGANLSGADLSGAESIKLPIISISGSKHSLWAQNDGNIRIGCENHSIAEWKKDYKEIGKNEKYTEEQIKEYYKYILQIEKMMK